jgi:hypothetical protein
LARNKGARKSTFNIESKTIYQQPAVVKGEKEL